MVQDIFRIHVNQLIYTIIMGFLGGDAVLKKWKEIDKMWQIVKKGKKCYTCAFFRL